MAQDVDASEFLKALDAKLPSVSGRAPSTRLSLPPGVHHASLKGVRFSTYKDAETGRQIPFLNWDFQCLSTQGKGEAYKRRTYSWFMRMDLKSEDLGDLQNFKGFIEALGLPASCRDSVTETYRLLEDPKVYRAETKGLIPHIEFQLTLGSKKNKRGEFPLFANFIRRIEPTEVGVFDDDTETEKPSTSATATKGDNGTSPMEAEPKEEDTAGVPMPMPDEVITDLDIVEVRSLLQEYNVAEETYTDAAEEDVRVAAAIIAAKGHDAEPPWSVAAETILCAGYGITKSRRPRSDVQAAITEKIMACFDSIPL